MTKTAVFEGSHFVPDYALMKMLYLITMRVSDKWTMPVQNWASIFDNLLIHFGDRVKLIY